MRKSVLIVCSMLLTFSLVFWGIGCKETAQDDSESTEEENVSVEEEASEGVSAESEEPVELTWIEWWEAEIGADLLDEMEAKFIEEHPNVTIKRDDLPWEQMYDKLFTLAQSGSLPDVMGVENDWASNLASMGATEPFDPYLESKGISDDQFVTNISRVNDKVYWLPIYSLCMFNVVNKDIFEAKGIEYPETWDEYLDAARELTDPGAGVYATAYDGEVNSYFQYFYFYPALLQAGGKFLDEEGKLAYNSEAGVKAMEFLGTLYKEDLVLPGTFSNTEKDKRTAFQSGSIAMYNDCTPGLVVLQQADLGFEFDFVKLPAGPVNRATFISSSSLAMAANSEHKDLAWEFVEFLTMGEGNKMWVESSQQTYAYKPNLETADYLEENKWLKVASEAMLEPGSESGETIEGSSTMTRMWTIEFQKYLNGEKTAKQALDDAVAAYYDALEKGEAE